MPITEPFVLIVTSLFCIVQHSCFDAFVENLVQNREVDCAPHPRFFFEEAPEKRSKNLSMRVASFEVIPVSIRLD